MTVATPAAGTMPSGSTTQRRMGFFPLALTVIALCIAAKYTLPWTDRWPEAWVIPLKAWVTQFFAWLGSEATLGLFTVKELTRFISLMLSYPLYWAEALLFRGFTEIGLPPLPWIGLLAGVVILGHWIAGRRLALLCGLSSLYIAAFGLWSDGMQTLSIVVVAVPLAAILGLIIGIWAVRSPKVEAFVTTSFDVLQATPHMAYLGPVVVLFGFGQVPAMLATLGFAMPPMARCVILGLKTVADEVVEAGRMAGCTRRQLLWKVQVPAASQTLLVGLNQVVMQTLAMAVIASLVGASGLGQKLLFSLQQLQIGKATEQGIAITLIAIVLDRLSQAYAYKPQTRFAAGTPFALRHRHMLLFLAVLAASFLVAFLVPALAVLPREMTLSYGPTLDQAVRWFSKNAYGTIGPVRDWITVWLLLPMRDFYLWCPWSLVVGLLGLAGWWLGGWRLAFLVGGLVAFQFLIGNWVPAMMTVYLVTGATLICILIGVPLGVWCSRNERVARVVMAICDTLQTFPSFIYLIPVIMLLKVGDLSNIVAILAYASVPSVRFTYLGITRISAATIEASRAAGTTSWQRLWKVELPIALPEIMLGINQTIMMALAMTAITALIGSRDLGQEIYKALPGADTGRGILAGLGIAAIGIIADRLIGAWAARRKKELGLVG